MISSPSDPINNININMNNNNKVALPAPPIDKGVCINLIDRYPNDKDAHKKVLRTLERREHLSHYLHITEIFFVIIMVMAAVLYQYTDFIKIYKNRFILELAMYSLSAILVYFFMLLWRKAYKTHFWQVFSFWNIVTSVVVAIVTMLVIVLVEVGGFNNYFVVVLELAADPNLSSDSSTTTTMNSSSASPTSTIDSSSASPISAATTITSTSPPIASNAIITDSSSSSASPMSATAAVITTESSSASPIAASNSTSSSAPSISPALLPPAPEVLVSVATAPPITWANTGKYSQAQVDTIYLLKNNMVATTIISSGIAFILILLGCLALAIGMILFYTGEMKTLNFYSYFHDTNFKVGSLLGASAIFWSFIFEVLIASFLTALPMALVIYNRNQVFFENNEHFHLLSDELFKETFIEVWAKIAVFYILAQLCGGFEWINDAFCRTKNGYNIVRPENDKDVYQHSIPLKVQIYRDKLNEPTLRQRIFGKKPVVYHTVPTFAGNIPIPNRAVAH